MTLEQVLQDPTLLLLDVRSGAEFRSGHLPNAINLPLDEIPYRYQEIDRLGKIPVLVYCRSGMRSSQAVAFLKSHGIDKVFDGGGMQDVKALLNSTISI